MKTSLTATFWRTLCGALSATALTATAHAASISFTQQLNGPVLVSHDNFDWQTFNFSSTNDTATADATLFKFADQGSLGDGTEAIFLKNSAGDVRDVLTASVHIIDSSTYSVHYEFFADSALPSVLPHSTGQYTDVFVQGDTAYVGLQSFSQGISVTAAVPEPQSAALMIVGLGLIGLVARRRKTR